MTKWRAVSEKLWKRFCMETGCMGRYSAQNGIFLGKFIYLLDAYDDVEEDIKNKNYNPFSEQYIIEGFDEQVRRILIMMMAQTCREFEKTSYYKNH